MVLEAPAASSRRDEDGDERQGENFTLQTGKSVPSSSLVIRCNVRNPLMVKTMDTNTTQTKTSVIKYLIESRMKSEEWDLSKLREGLRQFIYQPNTKKYNVGIDPNARQI